MSRQNKKERQRLKRKQKQLRLRKEKSTSIFQRVAKSTAPIKCYITQEWKARGMASILVLRPTPTGQVLVGFLVDTWCVGLKDAFGREGYTNDELNEYLERTASGGATVVPTDPGTARRLIAGGVVFSNKNGFKLPAKYDRYIAAVGITPTDIANADLSDFGGPDGKLRYVGTVDFLQKRLIGSVDDFMRRPDVEWVMGEPGPFDSGEDYREDSYEGDDGGEDGDAEDFEDEEDADADFEREDEEDDEDDPKLAMTIRWRKTVFKAARKWFEERGEALHPRLESGIALALLEWMAPNLSEPARSMRLADVRVALDMDSDPDGLRAAIAQAHQYLSSLKQPEERTEA